VGQIVLGFVFVVLGVTNLVFRKRFMRWTKEYLNKQLNANPTDGFLLSQELLVSALFIGFGGLAIVVELF
jgi:hypothetical protein